MPDIFTSTGTAEPKKGIKRRTKKENVVEAEKYSETLKNASTSKTAFAAYCPKPSSVTFEVQHDDEPVLLLLRQHPIVNIPWLLIALLMIVAPLILPYFPILSFLPSRFQVFAVIGWYLIIMGYVLENFIMWFYNVYIVTDERIIDVDFFSLIYKRISEAKIENIEDITSSNSGVLQTVIDYGDVRIQTAAEIPQIEFENVPHPERVSKFLSEMIMQEEQEKIEGRVR